jgi:phosphoglycerate dehydrogenase-like enzyme
MEKIAILVPLSEEIAENLKSFMPAGFTFSHPPDASPQALASLISDADYAVADAPPVTAELLKEARRLKLVHKWGTGTDNIDVGAAKALGIPVARTTGVNATPVAEFTLGLMISLGRGIMRGHLALREGRWAWGEIWRSSFMLPGRTVGIIGFGHIGQRLAELLTPFGCRILYHNRNRIDADTEARLSAQYADLPTLLAQSDIVILHCPLTPQTRGLIGRRELRMMKSSALLLNLARGGVVVEADLAEALASGEIAGAATDVFEHEPPPPDHPLLGLGNVIVTPHLGGTAFNNRPNIINHWINNIVRVSRGERLPPEDIVHA